MIVRVVPASNRNTVNRYKLQKLKSFLFFSIWWTIAVGTQGDMYQKWRELE